MVGKRRHPQHTILDPQQRTLRDHINVVRLGHRTVLGHVHVHLCVPGEYCPHRAFVMRIEVQNDDRGGSCIGRHRLKERFQRV